MTESHLPKTAEMFAKMDEQDEDLDSLLLCACKFETLSDVKALLEAGANAKDAVDLAGYTPLHRACMRRDLSPEIAEVLITAGADVNAKGCNRLRPLHLAAANNGDNAPLERDCLDVLISAGADPNLRDLEGRTALHVVTSLAYDSVRAQHARRLVEAGAHVDLHDNDDDTALSLAVRWDRLNWILDLVKLGADLDHPTSAGTPKELFVDRTMNRIFNLRFDLGEIPEALKELMLDHVVKLLFQVPPLIKSFHGTERPDGLTFDHQEPWS